MTGKLEREFPEGVRLVGYARVSTEDQNLDMQIDALVRAGVDRDAIYVEKVSGAARRRPQLDLALKRLREGDVLVVWRLDRLARSLSDLIRRIEILQAKGAGFKSLNEAVDTTTASGRLVLHIFGAVAEFERQLIADRTRAGMQSKMDKGWKPGVPPKLGKYPGAVEFMQDMRNAGATAPQIIAAVLERYGVKISRGTVYNWTSSPEQSGE